MKRFRILTCALVAMLAFSAAQAQAVTVTVGSETDPWLGYMLVTNLPAPDGDGAYQFEGGWGVPDLVATFDDPNATLTLSPNTIGDPNEYWYQNTTGMAADPANPGGPGQKGNKQMTASLYIEDTGTLNGEVVTFTGNVLSHTFTSAHVTDVFIRDFAPDYSSSVDLFVPLTTAGPFSISLPTINDPARHVQYGFRTVGENVWVTDTAPFGSIVLGTVPEPTSLALFGLGMVGLAVTRRRK
ncbi:PEP-CTERM sorting domain-containing protein [Adhaeretor mobilis]|uniref:PEP-CTERM motif protein n=1 Tax=Adhaeretor mobilis TaxID=1930276 RepID=A0A517MYE7_9BACT|nr:PEP-CTERM sorting domain-containing protein [Adhaeretor mobilis]QDS99905.1 PEP-CTERM motif protein [Adhaeretor mobilis]